MKLADLKNKKIAVLGLGIENYYLVLFLLKKKINIEITICDSRNKIELGDRYKKLQGKNNIKWQLGKKYNSNLDKQAVLMRSPGWPLFEENLQIASKKGAVIYSAIRLFFDMCPTKNIIGVTGTKGKGTTSSLIYAILKQAKKRAYLGGNIGVAPFEFIHKIKKNDWVVLEMSSFQLEDMKVSPRISVVVNLTREHLAPADPNNPNYHKSFLAYRKAKLNIVKWQKSENYKVLNRELNIDEWKAGSAKIVKFGKSSLQSQLAGDYNKKNISAAYEVAKILNINNNIIEMAVKSFKGLEHRIEFVRDFKGVSYYDNSFATTPEATIEDLYSFKNPKILLAGGSDKGSDFKNLAKEIKKNVKFLIMFEASATPRIYKELKKIKYPDNKLVVVKSMSEAVKIANEKSQAGDMVLLSTACASFGIFKNYKERGDLFKQEVKNLK